MLYNYKGKSTYCLCHCDCGNEKIISAANIIGRKTKSCGCLEKESRYGRSHSKLNCGDVYGKLTLIRDTGMRATNGSVIWECVCECGNTVETSSGDIVRGRVQSCGCDYAHPKLKNLLNMRFGLLTVIDLCKEKYKRVHWVCKCDCGTIKNIASFSLCNGNTVSCGCKTKSIKVKMISEYLKKSNIIYIEEHKFDDCRSKRKLPFDFYLPQLNTVIEYDGRQHYESIPFYGGQEGLHKRIKNDAIKNEYCKENGIKMIRLPYTLSDDAIISEINKYIC